ncbi:MAG: PQQ-binding-like beta-propeller repeat protein [Gammaproteobacteria bacterium]|nr:PQQ-binding-like beta-propeller repeat protein [Gammaproteobacteria bacterium]
MIVASTQSSARHWARAQPAILAVLALISLIAASVVLAAPPPGKGGGGGGKDGGSAGGYQPELHLLCRAPLDGIYSRVRPAVGADGTVYVVDTSKTLFAFNPDCTAKWPAVPNAGSKGLDVGPDGTIYTGTEDWIKAFNPSDGSLKWEFTQSPRAFILIDVAVDPDGYIYGVASSGMGVFALADEGDAARLVWQTPEVYGRPIVGSTEIAVGPSSSGGYQIGFAANGHVRVVRANNDSTPPNGETVFTLDGGRNPPRVSLLDGSWHVTNKAYGPDGDVMWVFDSGAIEAFMTPALDGDGTHYTIGQFGQAYAIDSAGTERWRTDLGVGNGSNQIDVDPSNSILVLNAGGTTTQPAALQALGAANGNTLWRMEFPAEPLGRDQYVDTNVAFSATGDTAYVVTAVASSNTSMPRAFLNVVSTDPSLPNASTILRAVDIAMDSRSKRRSVNFSGTVTVMDENRAAISGASVSAKWTLPDGSTQAQTADTGGGGRASFKIAGDGGVYRLTITDISKPDYTFDPQHSIMAGTAVGF